MMDEHKHRRLGELLDSLTNITPDADQVKRIEAVRSAAKELGARIVQHTDASRETSLALTKLEESVMWAVKSIALEGVRE